MFSFSAQKIIKTGRLHLNLLHPQGIQQKIHIRFFKWILSFGRYIAIFVEIIVLVAFAARFKLDAELASLNEQINSQIPFLESSVKDEIIIRQTQFKIDSTKQTLLLSPDWQNILTQIADQTPLGVTFTTLSFDHSPSSTSVSFKISGRAATNNDLALFLVGLKGEPKLNNIDLANVNIEENQFGFTITGATK